MGIVIFNKNNNTIMTNTISVTMTRRRQLLAFTRDTFSMPRRKGEASYTATTAPPE